MRPVATNVARSVVPPVCLAALQYAMHLLQCIASRVMCYVYVNSLTFPRRRKKRPYRTLTEHLAQGRRQVKQSGVDIMGGV